MKRFIVFSLAGVLTTSPLQAYEAGKFYYQGNTKEKVIALTFDDGPGTYTPQILDYLKAHHARATFFIEGDQVAAHPDYVRRIRDDGHEIGNHTYSHFNFHFVKDHPHDVFIKEFDKTDEAIQKALNDPAFKTKVLRMPNGAYGKFNRAWLIPDLKKRGVALVHWSFGEDWLKKRPGKDAAGKKIDVRLTSDVIAADYIRNAQPGAVFLMHDGGRHREKTFEALQVIVPALEKQGYRFVAAEDLFKN